MSKKLETAEKTVTTEVSAQVLQKVIEAQILKIIENGRSSVEDIVRPAVIESAKEYVQTPAFQKHIKETMDGEVQQFLYDIVEEFFMDEGRDIIVEAMEGILAEKLGLEKKGKKGKEAK